MAIIRQCRMNKSSMESFSFFMEKYNLRHISDRYAPAIFYGIYWDDIESILHHKGLAIAIWRGSDAMSKKRVKKCKRQNIKHVAISSFIEKDLTDLGIRYKFLPISSTNAEIFHPVPLGEEIYCYLPANAWEFYGGNLITEIQKRCKYKFNIVDSAIAFSKDKLKELYKRCFLALRLTPHDGLSNTVVEMGLMGRKCIYNDNRLPNAIHWSGDDVDSIVVSIDKEYGRVGFTDNELSISVRSYINIGEGWLDQNYWETI